MAPEDRPKRSARASASAPVAGIRPSTARRWSRAASSPIQAPLPSSPAGNPHPSTEMLVPSANSRWPAVPVPTATTEPGRPARAPIRLAWPSVISRTLQPGGAPARNAARLPGCRLPARAKPQLAPLGTLGRPAACAACAIAARTLVQARSMPRVRLPGPASPAPRVRPSASAMRARVPVAPPSTAIRRSDMSIRGWLVRVTERWRMAEPMHRRIASDNTIGSFRRQWSLKWH